jgi:3-oxoacyl-[acyl-carrier-protein] synthase-3
MPELARAHILGTGSFLPNEPVPNERLEAVLGCVGGRPSRARHRILKQSGILARHYAIDPETGRSTHTNAELTSAAIRELARASGLGLADIDCLACGTSSPDQLIPNHALMVHGELGNPRCEVVATTGTCLAGLTALKYAAMSVACGQARAAVATGSELSSSVMRASNFPRREHAPAEPALEELERDPLLAFGQDFLRWMLSDGAGAFLLGRREASRTGLSLAIEWIEIVSFANELEPCMYWGAEKAADGAFTGWRAAASIEDAVRRGMLNLTQDTRLLGREIARRSVVQGLGIVRERHPMEPAGIDWFLPHYSSEFFRQQVFDGLREIDFELPYERWFTNLATKGNTGSASIYVMLDELFRSGRLRAGQRILCLVPESARFSVGYFLLTVTGTAG